MIDFELSEEQLQIKALIKDFCEREVDFKELQRLADESGRARNVQELRALYPKDLMRKLHSVGLRQLCVPTEYGGGGFGQCASVTRAVAAEHLGYYMGIGSRLLTVPFFQMSAMEGTQEQRDWFFTQYMKDPTMAVAASASEPSGMTDLLLPYEEPGYPLKVFAHRDGDDWIINGDKSFCSGGGAADLIRVSARTDKVAPLSRARLSFWVRKDSPGMSYTVNRLLAGEIGGNVQVNYDNVRVPDSHRVGEVNSPPGKASGGSKIMVFIDWLGHCQRIYEQVVNYAKERKGGGVPIIQHSSIAAMLGEIALNINATRAYAYQVCWENDQREKAGKVLVSWDKSGVGYWVRKTSALLCEAGFEIYAGMGGSLDLEFEGLVRRTYTWPQGNKTIHATKYSMLNNSHILACQANGKVKETVNVRSK